MPKSEYRYYQFDEQVQSFRSKMRALTLEYRPSFPSRKE